MLVGVAWALWLVGWIRRVELRSALEPTVAALGLRWQPEGLRGRVCAAGECEGRAVEIIARWSRVPPVVHLKVGDGKWLDLGGAFDAERVRAVARGG